MAAFLLRRLVVAALVALTVSVLAFALVFVAGDPATALSGQSGRAADVEYLRRFYGLDRPLLVQYGAWLARLGVGDFGNSLFFGFPVAALIAERLPVTIALGLAATAFAVGIGVPLGVLAATRPNGPVDLLVRLVAAIGQAMPTFWFGLMLIILFGILYPVLPISGAQDWRGFVLPTVVLGYYATPAIMRLTRAGMIEVLSSDYVRTARAKGLRPPVVLFKHALRNAVLPVVSLTAVQMGALLSGSIVVESVFALNGVGRLAWESILRSDLPTMQAIVLLFSLFYVALTLAADLVNAWLDPRLRVRG
ncbi:MAG: ABC transporter permease [Alphaproteobacteria bacterium]|nr:ABC transporter permease [Alphaproteobacteria bacterium]